MSEDTRNYLIWTTGVVLGLMLVNLGGIVYRIIDQVSK